MSFFSEIGLTKASYNNDPIDVSSFSEYFPTELKKRAKLTELGFEASKIYSISDLTKIFSKKAPSSFQVKLWMPNFEGFFKAIDPLMGEADLYAAQLRAESNFCEEGDTSQAAVLHSLSHPLIPSTENLDKATRHLEDYSYREPIPPWVIVNWYSQTRRFSLEGEGFQFCFVVRREQLSLNEGCCAIC